MKAKKGKGMQRLSRSLSQFETQDIKTQPQFNHYLMEIMVGAEECLDKLAHKMKEILECASLVSNWT